VASLGRIGIDGRDRNGRFARGHVPYRGRRDAFSLSAAFRRAKEAVLRGERDEEGVFGKKNEPLTHDQAIALWIAHAAATGFDKRGDKSCHITFDQRLRAIQVLASQSEPLKDLAETMAKQDLQMMNEGLDRQLGGMSDEDLAAIVMGEATLIVQRKEPVQINRGRPKKIVDNISEDVISTEQESHHDNA
jgi:hypothetical protein